MAKIIHIQWIKEVKIKVPKNDTDFDIVIFSNESENIYSIMDIPTGCIIVFNDDEKHNLKFEFMSMEKTYYSAIELSKK